MADAEFEFDDTRKAIGAEDLDDRERKAMLNKFKDAGGEVLSERELRRQQNAEAEGSTPPRRGSGGSDFVEVTTPSQMARKRRKAEADKRARIQGEWQKVRKRISRPGAKFFIKLRCALKGITFFSSNAIKPKFISFLALEVKSALTNFNFMGNELFLKDPAVSQKIIKSLDDKNTLLMEVLETAHMFYKDDDFDKLTEQTLASPKTAVSLESIVKPMKHFYKRLYYLYPYQETLKKAITLAINIRHQNGASDEDMEYLDQLHKKILKDIKNVFHSAFPRLFDLICLADMMDYPPFSELLERAIGVVGDEKLGKRKKGDHSGLTQEVKEAAAAESSNKEDEKSADGSAEAEGPDGEEEKEKEELKRPIQATKEYQYGMSLMNMYKLPELRKKCDSENRFSKLILNDKVLLSYLFFIEYDLEYAFVQTTNKITMNVDYSHGVKTDFKRILADLYNESRDITRAFEQYYQSVLELGDLKKSKLSSNYIEQSKLETKQEKNVNMEARNTRGLIQKYMDVVTKHLAQLIADMKTEKKIIANIDDPVKFESNFEGKKRLNGKLVKQCIMEAYCYSLALKERLESGELYGGSILLNDEEMITSFGSTFKEVKEA